MLVITAPHVWKFLTSLTICLRVVYLMALSAFGLRNASDVKTTSNIRTGKELADTSEEGLRKIPKHLSRDSRCP